MGDTVKFEDVLAEFRQHTPNETATSWAVMSSLLHKYNVCLHSYVCPYTVNKSFHAIAYDFTRAGLPENHDNGKAMHWDVQFNLMAMTIHRNLLICVC